MAKYSYTQIPDSKKIWRPYLAVSYGFSKSTKFTPPLPSLLDSGADVCMGSKDIALWLGIEFDTYEDQFSIVTANGSISKAVKKIVTVQFADKKIACPFFFVEDITPDQAPLLGQQGFFDQFKVCFDLKNKTFEVD